MRYKIFMFNNVDLFSKPMVKFKRAVSDLPFPEADHPITKSSQKSSSHLMSQSQRFQYLWNQINYLVTINKLWEFWTHMSYKKRSLKKKRTAKFPKDEFAAFFIIWLYFFVFFTIEKKGKKGIFLYDRQFRTQYLLQSSSSVRRLLAESWEFHEKNIEKSKDAIVEPPNEVEEESVEIFGQSTTAKAIEVKKHKTVF